MVRSEEPTVTTDVMMNSSVMRMMDAVVIAMMSAVPGYFVLQAWLLWRLQGGWRKAAAAPLWPMALVLSSTPPMPSGTAATYFRWS